MHNKKTWMTLATGMFLGTSLLMAQSPVTEQAAERGTPRRGWEREALAELNLSGVQQVQISALQAEHRAALEKALAHQRETQMAMQNEARAPVFNEQKLRAACRHAAAAQEEIIVLRARQASQVRALLHDEQRVTYDARRARMSTRTGTDAYRRERGRERRGRPGRTDPQTD